MLTWNIVHLLVKNEEFDLRNKRFYAVNCLSMQIIRILRKQSRNWRSTQHRFVRG
jgi:hypothetical protein